MVKKSEKEMLGISGDNLDAMPLVGFLFLCLGLFVLIRVYLKKHYLRVSASTYELESPRINISANPVRCIATIEYIFERRKLITVEHIRVPLFCMFLTNLQYVHVNPSNPKEILLFKNYHILGGFLISMIGVVLLGAYFFAHTN